MRISRFSFILVFAVASLLPMMFPAGVGGAIPLGATFTYQGRLIDNNQPADGLYDLQFRLYDASVAGNKLGGDANIPDLGVEDGYFTVELNFGDVFDGNTCFLEIGARPGWMSDPNGYTVLVPRQRVTAAPYALYALNSGGTGGGGIGGSGTTNYVAKFTSASEVGNSAVYENSGKVGIGTTSPSVQLHLDSASGNTGLRLNSTAADGDVYIGMDIDGIRKFSVGVDDSDEDKFKIGTGGLSTNVRLAIDANGSVGVGTTTPDAKLAVADGGIKATDDSTSAIGVQGIVTTAASTTHGGWFESASNAGRGVYGNATSGSGTTYGGYFRSASTSGIGVYGYASQSSGSTIGGWFKSYSSSGKAVQGEASSATGTNYGGYFTSAGDNSAVAVYGEATNSGVGVVNYGGQFQADGASGVGVQGRADGDAGTGVVGRSNGDNGTGVTGSSYGSGGRGILGRAYGTTGSGILGQGFNGSRAGSFQGDVLVQGKISAEYSVGTTDFAMPIAYAFINSDGTVNAGTPNVSSTWNAANSRYEITISGETYDWKTYVTVVTASSNLGAYIPGTDSYSGKLIVYIYTAASMKTQMPFQFATFKP